MTSSAPKPVRVELAYPLDYNGQRYEPDAVVELPNDKAMQLVQDGRARWAAQDAPAPAQATATQEA